ncbi:MAG: DNA gyrase subunit A, partial [Selenomonas sp.]|nr:DNA gyrase subunit A [Selenomonas sp.]
KAKLVESIAQLVRDKEIEGITALNDESDRSGMRIVIDLRRDANANVILNQLYKHTKLQDSFGVIMLALVDGKPQVLNLKQVLHYYIKHQEDVITRRTRYELKKAEARAHILEGLTIALDHLDAVITTIRESRTAEIAKTALMEGFKLSDKQAQAILDLRLQRLTGLEREKIEQEYQETLAAIEEYKAILADESRILGIIKDELTEVKKKFGDARRTKLTIDTSEINVEDLIAEEDVVITLTHNNYIKRIPLDTYRRQNRGGKGVKGMPTKEKDFVEDMLITTTHHTILFFTNRGRVYHLKAYEIAEASRTAKGTAIINLLQLQQGESIRAIIQVKEFNPDDYLFMATKKGIVKKTSIIEFQNLHKGGLNAINLDEDDDLIGVKFTSGAHDVILGTKWGMAIAFSEDDVRAMGRPAHGVKGIRLNDGDEVIGMDTLKQNAEVLTVTAEGYGKRTETGEYRLQTRGGKGLINLKVTEKTGDVIGLRVVHPDQELMLITAGGIVIRTNISDISVISRNTQGVKLMDTADGDVVASMAILDQKD